MKQKQSELYIMLISIHGLIRGDNLELGRDADTGGQTKYVVELARALAKHPQVARVDLLTRLNKDDEVSDDYAQPYEVLEDNARIVRLVGGPEGYIRKEELWDHMDNFADNALDFIRQSETPDIIHSHYADAGYVGLLLSNNLSIPLIHTGHSLGRVKRRRLLASGLKKHDIENRYHMSRRIEAEEDTLASAELIIASSSNEIEAQYGLYDFYQPDRMANIPPGTDLVRFHAPTLQDLKEPIRKEIERFLKDPEKPIILALSRPDERKNIATLLEAYGESPALQEKANLVIIAGSRDDLRDMESGPRAVLNEILLLIDVYNLYGKVSYPKHHQPNDVPIIYRLAAISEGVFVNPALTEPFGLTLIEAAASGLPLVATEDGGPRDIVANCQNGVLVDPLDKQAIASALLKVLSNKSRHEQLVKKGLVGVRKHYSWVAHATKYIETITPILTRVEKQIVAPLPRRELMFHDRAIIVELDCVLLGDPEALGKFVSFIRKRRKATAFGIATGRRLESALKVLKEYRIPMPDVLIARLGTELYYAPQLTADIAWTSHIDHLWSPRVLRRLLSQLQGLKLQPKIEQSPFKLSYYIDPDKAPGLEEINSLLRQEEKTVNVFLSYGQFLDILPTRASKGFALRYFSDQFDIPLHRILVAGATAGDQDMIRGNTLSVAVDNPHRNELEQLADVESVYFSRESYAQGVLEAIEYYDFFNECRAPVNE